MAKLTPEQAAQKWTNNLSAATQSMQQGVQNVTTAPGVAAARSADLWAQRVAAAKDKWRNRVANTSLTDWQQAMVNKGIPRVAEGAQAAQPKMQDFLRSFLPHVYAGAEQVKSMPKGTVEQGIARAAAQIRHNASYRRSQ